MTSRWILSRMRNVSNKSCSFFFENRAVYEIMSKNMVEPERPQMTTWRRVACSISKATRARTHASVRAPTPTYARTHARTHKYEILIVFPRQQWSVNAPQCYVVRPLVVLFHSDLSKG
jgi:hypothetical protein